MCDTSRKLDPSGGYFWGWRPALSQLVVSASSDLADGAGVGAVNTAVDATVVSVVVSGQTLLGGVAGVLAVLCVVVDVSREVTILQSGVDLSK